MRVSIMFVTYPFSHEERGDRATAAYQPCQDSPSPESPNTIHMPCSPAQNVVAKSQDVKMNLRCCLTTELGVFPVVQ
jgi:hypothetical protein